MKKIILISFVFLFFNLIKSQGKYSYEFSTLIGKKFITEKDLPELKSFKYQQGKVLGEISPNAPYFSSLEVFKKGNTAIVILEKNLYREKNEKAIIEVLKITKILKNQEIRISGCTRKNPYPDEEIVAVTLANSKKIKVYQAFVLKDIRFEKLNIKTIKCRNEMDD